MTTCLGTKLKEKRPIARLSLDLMYDNFFQCPIKVSDLFTALNLSKATITQAL